MFWYALCIGRPPAQPGQALEALALRALRFTPSVSLQPAGAGLLLEVEPSLRYFGGPQALLAYLRAELAESGLSVSVGWAPTASAAWLLARWRDGAGCTPGEALDLCLGPLPTSLLDSVHEHAEALESMGLRRLGQLLALPRAALAHRFGQALLDELDRCLGRLPDPRRWYEIPPRFEVRLELPVQADAAPALSAAAGRLVRQLSLWLAARHKAARRFVLRIEHRPGQPETVVAAGLAEPAWQDDRLFTLLRERLSVIRLAEPARALRLCCDELDDAAPANRTLLAEPAVATGMLGPLLERLQARLGRGQVQRLRARADHRPEAAWQVCEAGLAVLRQPPGADACLASLPCARLPRPLWLLDSPLALQERGGRPWREGPLALLAGPERIESGWWDGRPVQRDYFIAEDAGHRLLWIYLERPCGATRAGWFLHGCFG